MVAYSFNSQQHTPQYGGGSGGLPANDDGSPRRYKVVIVNSGLQNVEKNNQIVGGFMAFELTPVEGPLQGQKHTDRLNLNHTNPQTVEIANKQLSAYCHVLGKFQFQDTQELHNIPFFVDIGLQKEPNPNRYTEVKAVFDINGNEPGKAGAGQQVNQNQQGGGNNAPPNEPAGGVQAQGQWNNNAGGGGGNPNPPQNQGGGQGGGWGGQPDQSQNNQQQGGNGGGWGNQGGQGGQNQQPQNQQQGGGQWGNQGGGQGGGNPPGWGAAAQ